MNKKTLVIGASDKPWRYSYQAISRLKLAGHPVIGFGLHKGIVQGVQIETDWKAWSDIHTITLYINPDHQLDYYTLLPALHPKRVIFNPGTENELFAQILQKEGITVLNACTLVMLSVGSY